MRVPSRREALSLAAVAPLGTAAGADDLPPPPARPRPAFTTPPPPVDPAVAVPELAGKARCCVRLHPRPTPPGNPPPDASGIGFMPLWPRAEAWPTCPEHRAPLAPVLQLRKDDVPELGFRPGTDLFQLLWCPRHHADAAPRPAVFWRTRVQVADRLLAAAPRVEVVDDGYKTRPCAVHPERVFDYPDRWELSAAQQQAVGQSAELRAVAEGVGRALPDDGSRPGDGLTLYQRWLGAAPGTKVGGYPDWVQDPAYPACGCGARMAHLLTLASWEWDGGSWPRWMPAEDRNRLRDGKATGWMLGDAGNLHLFVCRRCNGWPVRWALQSS